MKQEKKKTYIIFLIGFLIGVIGFSGSLFMYLTHHDPIEIYYDGDLGDVEEIMPSGLVFNSIDKSIHLDKAIPTLDKFGVLEAWALRPAFQLKNIKNEDKEEKKLEKN